MTTSKMEFRVRQCARVYYPGDPRVAYRCPQRVFEGRRADAIYCSDGCARAAKRQRYDARQRGGF